MLSTSHREFRAAPAGVLIVDDEEPARTFVRRALRDANVQVREAENLTEARRQLRHSSIELALCDLSLGNENGLELLGEICQSDSKVAAVIVTSNDDARMAINCLRTGAYDYLLKPYTVAELQNVVFRTLERRRARAAEDGLRQRLEALETFSSQNPNPILQIARDGTVRYANEASRPVLDVWGIELGDALPEDVCPAELLFTRQTEAIQVECGGRLVSLTVTNAQEAEFVYLHGHDITDSADAHRQLTMLKNRAQALAFHDTLTGLPNRLLMEHRFEHEMARCDQNSPNLAMVFVDLDRFKQINDTRGHRSGDQVLVSAAKHMSRCVGGVDRVTRWGGDEMVLMLPGVDPREAREVCEHLKLKVQALVSKECRVPVTMSMGVAIYPDDGERVDELVHAADAALLEAKRIRNNVVVFGECPELRFLRHDHALRPLLSKAISGSKIALVYEPIADLMTGGIVGMDVRIHWHHHEFGRIPQKTIIAMAEGSGLLDKLFRQVIRRALKHTANCLQLGYQVDLAVSIPVRQLSTGNFAVWIQKACLKSGIPPESVILEVLDDEDLTPDGPSWQCLSDLSRAGFQLSKSVICRGRPSLVDLDQFGVRELKIDAGAIRNLDSVSGRRPVETLVKIAQTLGMGVVATAVESQEQLDMLAKIGVKRIQGKVLSEAVSAQSFAALLQKGISSLLN